MGYCEKYVPLNTRAFYLHLSASIPAYTRRDMPAGYFAFHHATIASLNRCSKSSALAGTWGEFGDAVLGEGAFDEGGDVAFGESDC